MDLSKQKLWKGSIENIQYRWIITLNIIKFSINGDVPPILIIFIGDIFLKIFIYK
jgi:hypothetical protein